LESLPELLGNQVYLRPLRMEDGSARRALGFDAEYERMLGHDAPLSQEMTEDQADQWYRSRMGQPVCWAITFEARCIGTVGFVTTYLRQRWAMLAVEIFDPSMWNRGFGTDAVRLVLGYGFHTMRLHRVGLSVLGYNQRAIRAYEKCGFVREGVERDATLVDGEWQNHLMMGILEDEFRAQTKATSTRVAQPACPRLAH
jgi:RimJ/RimL family protein N-acetyltransferase